MWLNLKDRFRYVVIEEIGLDIWSKNSEFCFDMQILRKIGLDMQILKIG